MDSPFYMLTNQVHSFSITIYLITNELTQGGRPSCLTVVLTHSYIKMNAD